MRTIKNLFGIFILFLFAISCTPEELPNHINSNTKISADSGDDKEKVVDRDGD